MQTEQKPVPETVKKKGGRPAGYSPVKAEPQQVNMQATEEGEYIVIRVHKRVAAKLLFKDLI